MSLSTESSQTSSSSQSDVSKSDIKQSEKSLDTVSYYNPQLQINSLKYKFRSDFVPAAENGKCPECLQMFNSKSLPCNIFVPCQHFLCELCRQKLMKKVALETQKMFFNCPLCARTVLGWRLIDNENFRYRTLEAIRSDHQFNEYLKVVLGTVKYLAINGMVIPTSSFLKLPQDIEKHNIVNAFTEALSRIQVHSQTMERILKQRNEWTSANIDLKQVVETSDILIEIAFEFASATWEQFYATKRAAALAGTIVPVTCEPFLATTSKSSSNQNKTFKNQNKLSKTTAPTTSFEDDDDQMIKKYLSDSEKSDTAAESNSNKKRKTYEPVVRKKSPVNQ